MNLRRTLYCVTLTGLTLLATLVLSAAPAAAQGVTTAAVAGRVTDTQGAPLENITVTVTNTGTGIVQGNLTDSNGYYFVPGVQIGGPYTVEASGLGYAPKSRTGLRVTLGQRLEINFSLEEQAVEVAGITAVINPTANQIINPNRTGQEQLVSENLINNLPTIGRNFTDFIDLSPLTGSGGGSTAVANENNRFNSIQIDGVVTQDIFGLGSTGQPGGQAGARSISIEAVKEYQVVAAPFDVRQAGFTGGLINAVTKTGTNEWKGSGYFYFRNQDFVRDKLTVNGTDRTFGNFTNKLYGATVSGPFVKDKVHFFGSVEIEQDNRPGSDVTVGVDAPERTGVAVADAQRFVDLLSQKGVNPGGFGPFTVENPNRNWFGRVDAQLNQNNMLTIRHNYVHAEDDVTGNRGGFSTYSLSSNFYAFKTTSNEFVSQLNSTLGKVYNEATFGWNRIRDRRDPVVRYPEINVRVSDPGGGTTTLRDGAEFFSQGNELDQDNWNFQDNLSFNWNEHRITLGLQDQIFKFRNLFFPGKTGSWTFNSLDDFAAGTPSSFFRNVPVTPGLDLNARFSVNQFSVYGQTEYRGIDNVVLTAGLRWDQPMYLDDPLYNPLVEDAIGRRTDQLTGNGTLSPRFGFNWDVDGEGQTQVRGGVGLFTGRFPFVWLSNIYGNTGLSYAGLFCSGSSVPAFTLDPNGQPETCAGGGGPGSGGTPDINLIDPNFEWPNAWRVDAAVDQTLPGNIVGTAEFLYTKYRKQIFLRELNVDFAHPISTTQGGRPVFGTHVSGVQSGGNNGFATPNRIDDRLGHVVELTNSDRDWAYSLIFQAQKRYSDGFEMNASYTYSDAEAISGLTSSIATSNIGFNPVTGSPNDPPLSTSDYLQKHKFTFGGSWDVNDWFTWSVLYVANTGDRYSYTYDGDVNADGYESPSTNNRNNDLIYVPMNASDITLVDPSDWTTLDAYIQSEPCLRENRGRIIAPNSCTEPWRNRVDTRFTFKVPTIGGQRAELVFDIFNVLNLLNQDWGRNKGVQFATIDLLQLRGWDDANNRGIFDLNRVNLDDAGNADPYTVFDTSSRWQAQIGFRYAVN